MGLIYRGEYADPGKIEHELEAMDSAITKLQSDVVSADDGYMDVTVGAVSATLTVDDAGEVLTNDGATAAVIYSLPTAAVGLVFNAYVADAQHVYVTAYNGDTIRIAGNVTAAAGSIQSNVVGSYVSLLAINATEWVAVSAIGSWTF